MINPNNHYYGHEYVGGEMLQFPPIRNISESGEAISEEEQEKMAIKQISQMSKLLSDSSNIIHEQTDEILKKYNSNHQLRDVFYEELELKNLLVNECDVLKTHHQSLQRRSKELEDEILILSKLDYPPVPASALNLQTLNGDHFSEQLPRQVDPSEEVIMKFPRLHDQQKASLCTSDQLTYLSAKLKMQLNKIRLPVLSRSNFGTNYIY